MGAFSPKFLAAAKHAARVLQGTLYARYYGIDTDALLLLPDEDLDAQDPPARPTGGGVAGLCAERAGVPPGRGIEQQQILPSHHLALRVDPAGPGRLSDEQLDQAARCCFTWVCRRLQIRGGDRHGLRLHLKNAAYAWRQMVFFLALCPAARQAGLLDWMHAQLQAQPAAFRARFEPVWQGLRGAVTGAGADDTAAAAGRHVRPFTGWFLESHGLLADG